MPSKLRQLHPLALVPTVVALWLFGSTILLFAMSALNVPGVNEHGSGLLIAVVTWFGAVIAALAHVLVILKDRRRINNQKASA